MTLGETMRAYRTQRGMTLAKLGTAVEMNPNYLGRIENDYVKASWQTVIRVCEVLNVSPNDMANWEDERSDAYVRRARASIIATLCDALQVNYDDLVGETEEENLVDETEEEEIEHAQTLGSRIQRAVDAAEASQ